MVLLYPDNKQVIIVSRGKILRYCVYLYVSMHVLAIESRSPCMLGNCSTP